MNRKYLTLTSRINEELSGLKRIVLRIQKAYECAEKSNDDLYLDSVALNLHGFYSAMENIFELIAKNVDQTIPDGELWHQELLKQMLTEIKQVRPSIISRETFEMLNEYRAFRHVVRNVYTFNLSFKKLKPLVDDLNSVFEKTKKEIEEFVNFIESSQT